MMGEQIGLTRRARGEDEGQARLITNAPNTIHICYMNIDKEYA